MIKIDYEKIKENLLKFDLNTYLVLKSNAYGFGFRRVLDLAIEASLTKFCVIDFLDAIYIKDKYPFASVLLLGVFDIANLLIYEKNNIMISINDIDELELLKDSKVLIQLKINSGMNRFGLSPNEIERALVIIDKYKLNLVGIYSHNATSNKNIIKQQEEAFFYAIKNVYNIDIHYAASSLINEDNPLYNSKRIGAAIYENVLSVYGKIIKKNFVFKDEYIGYDYSYKMKEDGFIGVIDLGYADGLERNCEGFFVYINNNYYPLVGKSCMNHCFVLLDSDVKVSDIVHFISTNNNISNYQSFFGKIKHEIYLRFLSK